MGTLRLLGLFVTALFMLGCAGEGSSDSSYIFSWVADMDHRDSDFLAVIDANPQSEAYGDVLTTVEVGAPVIAHHTEHRMSADGVLFMNGFSAGRTFIADLRDPMRPTIQGQFMDIDEYSYPHSFERLPNGNVLATFQTGAVNREQPAGIAGLTQREARNILKAARGDRIVTGGLVELTPDGQHVRSSSAANSEIPNIRPYSLVILPDEDRVVTTTTDMWGEAPNDSIQIWRLSDLALLHTLRLPPGPRGDENRAPAEPRLMADGETLLISTFQCGLYELREVADTPSVSHIYTFAPDVPVTPTTACSLPVTVGPYWIHTIPGRTGLVSLDVSNTEEIREVGYVDLGEGVSPHWVSLEPNQRRIVVGGFGALLHRLMVVEVDESTGALSIDTDFGENGSVSFDRTVWPHGETGPAIPHGTVFSIP